VEELLAACGPEGVLASVTFSHCSMLSQCGMRRHRSRDQHSAGAEMLSKG
jgi:hypothetical protein